jgi:hypothetical protein
MLKSNLAEPRPVTGCHLHLSTSRLGTTWKLQVSRFGTRLEPLTDMWDDGTGRQNTGDFADARI